MGAQAARTWDARVGSWEGQLHDSPGLMAVRDAVLELAAPRPQDRCVDLGAGTGLLTHPLATRTAEVLAVDVSPAMLERLNEGVPEGGNVRTMVADLATLELPDASVDLIVSSYALHHLEHPGKRDLVQRCARWLAPGGRLVVGDMMFGRGASSDDWRILAAKVRTFAVRGPAGWWRIARNVGKLGLGVGTEHPAPPSLWVSALQDAGFKGVRFERVVEEAGTVSGWRPQS